MRSSYTKINWFSYSAFIGRVGLKSRGNSFFKNAGISVWSINPPLVALCALREFVLVCDLVAVARIRADFMDKQNLTERDICTKFITPALRNAGWDEMLQIREEFSFTKGRIIVRGKLVSRGRAKRADYILYYKPNIPLALIEAKDNSHSIGEPPAVASLFVLSLNEREVRLGSRLAEEECADGFFRNGHVALPTDPIFADQIIDNRWRNSVTP
jgi:hypothetical protein